MNVAAAPRTGSELIRSCTSPQMSVLRFVPLLTLLGCQNAAAPADASAADGDVTESCTASPGGRWSRLPDGGAPSPRTYHTGVWTGSELIVWGGSSAEGVLGSGGRFDPSLGTWGPTTIDGAPEARSVHGAVWTDVGMLVWAGERIVGDSADDLSTGGLYDPGTDAWEPISTLGAPSPRAVPTIPTVVWTGTEMITWGGSNVGLVLGNGGRYDPTTDTWRPMASAGAPSARFDHTVVWTGTDMIVWGGFDGQQLIGTGARYNPETDTWRSLSNVDAPSPRHYHSAVWTGTEMIIWAGDESLGATSSGGAYDPATDTWRSTAMRCAPTPRLTPAAVWTGGVMLVWGGARTNDEFPVEGGIYDPVADTWRPMESEGAPEGRAHPVGVWTGTELIVWGGDRVTSYDATGGRFAP